MNRLTFLALCLLILSVVSAARAQTPLDRTITRLQREIAVRESIDRDAKIPPNHKAINRPLLEERRSQLVAVLQERMRGRSLTKVERYHAPRSLRTLAPANTQQSSAATTVRPRRVFYQTPQVAGNQVFHNTPPRQSQPSGSAGNTPARPAANATLWAPVQTRDQTSFSPSENNFLRASERSPKSRSITRINQSRVDQNVQGQPRPRTAWEGDPCAGRGNLREIRVYWDTGTVSPKQLKHSGGYCITVFGANTVLYSYLIDVEAESPSGNPFDALAASIAVLKKGFVGDAKIQSQVLNDGCELKVNVEDVTARAAELDTALDNLAPKRVNGKVKSIPLAKTIADFVLVSGRFADLKTSVGNLRWRLNQPITLCSQAEKNAARALVRNFDDVDYQYKLLKARVDSPPPAKAYEELEETNKTKITIREMYERQQTEAPTLSLNIAPGYSLISASAGFMVTQVPARSYSSRTAPDPANPTTATQNVLGIDGGSGTRPALVALLHYNLPFIQQRRLGLALSVGPVYDISGGKADTSKIGLFGGASLRFSEWLYITPGFHIGEFADFPQGFTRSGQVIPPNTGEPVPVKRYTTRFALGVTFKVKDLGFAPPPGEEPDK